MSNLIESEARFPGASIDPDWDRGLELPPKAAEDLRAFVVAPDAVGHREEKGGDPGEGNPSRDTGASFDGSPDVPGREVSQGVSSRPTLDPESRLLDILMPRETAEGAIGVYLRAYFEHGDPVRAMQQAFAYMAEAEHYHRHLRGGGR